MAFRRLSMRKVHLVLRLFFAAGLSIRAISRSIKASPSTVGDYIRRAEVAGLTWPLPTGMDESALEARLFPSVPPGNAPRALPRLGRHLPRAQAQRRHPVAAVAGVQSRAPR